MKPEVVIRELTNMLYELESKADREESKSRFEESITDLFNHIKIRENTKQDISEIPDSWPPLAKKLFIIFLDYMAHKDTDLTFSYNSEEVTICFN